MPTATEKQLPSDEDDGLNDDDAAPPHEAAAVAATDAAEPVVVERVDGGDVVTAVGEDGACEGDNGVVSDIVAAAAALPPDDFLAGDAAARSLDDTAEVAAAAVAADLNGAAAHEPAPALPPPEPVEAAPAQTAAAEKGDAMTTLQTALKFRDRASRERVLLKALRDSRHELEDAELANSRANERLADAKEAYELCARYLAGYTPLEEKLETKKKTPSARAGVVVDSIRDARRIKLESGAGEARVQYQPEALEDAITAAASMAAPRMKGQVEPQGTDVVLPTNEIYLPEYFVKGGGMDESVVSQFRDSFYLNLTKNQADASTIDQWEPPKNNANLKSKAQLDEWMHIVTHWNTGADGLDAGAFRAKHKTFYSRMKPVSYNLGRRTGIHLRQLDIGGIQGQDEKGITVLCRYNKAGNKSIVYLEVPRLFDALFQIHALELAHRGRDATKNLADERYANVPDAVVRAFLDTCPACAARRGQSTQYEPTAEAAHAHRPHGV